MSIPKDDEDKIMLIALPMGEDNVLMASDTPPSLGQELVQGYTVYISVQPSSKDETDRMFNSLSEGGEIEMPIADQGGAITTEVEGQVRSDVDGQFQPAKRGLKAACPFAQDHWTPTGLTVGRRR